jgi:putative transposase
MDRVRDLLIISKPSRSAIISAISDREETPMSQHDSQEKPLPTIWRVPDELWEKIEPILAERDPPKRTGRRRIDQRAALNAIIFRLRTGCQWNRLPSEFPDDSSVHRAFQRWIELGVLDRIWAALVEECEELGDVEWEWQAADGAMGKARFGGTSSVPTPPTGLRTA